MNKQLQQSLDWMKQNKIIVILLATVVFLLLRENGFSAGRATSSVMMDRGFAGSIEAPAPMLLRKSKASNVSSESVGGPIYTPGVDAKPDQARMVSLSTTLSLKVEDVAKKIASIQEMAAAAGGFMVQSNMTAPEGAASGSITIRVPSTKLAEILTNLRGMAVKVVSENNQGTDITDQFSDVTERLRILTATKQQIEAILRAATKVSDMLEVQRELTNVQQEIDDLVGQKQYLEESSRYSLVSVYLATDELALPYAPAEPWRPQAIIAEAVRSLIGHGRAVVGLLIWIGVYAPVWLAALLLGWMWRRKQQRAK